MLQLKDKLTIVTGAGRGIGKSIAIVFAELRADLVLVDIDQSGLESTVKEVKKRGQRAYPVVADITKLRDIKNLVQEAIQAFGKIDILVNNAGVAHLNSAEKLTEEQWDKTMAVNLKGLFFLSQRVGRHMIQKKSGKIVNIASQAGVIALDEHVAYSASKAGVIAITKTLALEWGKYNINVNAVAPTIIMTPMGK